MNATEKILRKDIDKLETRYAKGKIYQSYLIKEQEKLLEKAQKTLQQTISKIESVRKELEEYVDGEKETDARFVELRAEYTKLILSRKDLQTASRVLTESIEGAKLSRLA